MIASSDTRSALKQSQFWFFEDRKSTRLNSSHSQISYAVFCLKKNNANTPRADIPPIHPARAARTAVTCCWETWSVSAPVLASQLRRSLVIVEYFCHVVLTPSP